MQPARPPARIVEIAETASTNADAWRLAMQGEELPLWVWAQRQTAGRGRAGRTWISLEGNLCASVAVRCQRPLAEAGQLALVAGVAFVDAVNALSAKPIPGLRLKWPNDLLIGKAKAGGILIESQAPGREKGFLAVIGIGANVKIAPAGLDRASVALQDFGFRASAGDLLLKLAKCLDQWLAVWQGDAGFEAVRQAWLRRAGEIGEFVTINSANGIKTGQFAGLDQSGALIICIDGCHQTVTYGDVEI